MACGMLAMLRSRIEVESYDAYEIDKYAIQTATHNFPNIKEHGDVFKADFTEYLGTINIMMGGSPCTYWSIAQATDRRETTASGIGWELFSQYIRALKEAKPDYFIYENNKSMSKAIYESISDAFGFEPIMINSALVSAQNRQRLYWVGKKQPDGSYAKVEVNQPDDRGILLKDIIDGVVDREKSRAIIGSIGRTTPREYLMKNQGQVSFEPVGMASRGRNPSGEYEQQYEARSDGKSNAITTVQKDCMVGEPVCMRYERNKTAKALRRDYEAGRIHHGRNEHKELQPRPDGKSNTLTTVLKDNPICEPVIFNKPRGKNNGGFSADKSPTVTASRWEENHEVCEPVGCVQVGALPRPNGELSKSQAFRIYDVNAKSVTLKAGGGGAGGKTGLYAVPVSPVKVGEVGNGGQGNRIYDVEGKSVTLQANSGGMGSNTGLYAIPIKFDGDIPTKAISCADGKTYKVHEVKDGLITIKEKQYPIKLQDGYYIIRKLTVSECKRLQTVPEWYEFPVSNTQGYKMLGNGWTVDVIAHIINCIVEERSEING